MGEKTIMKTMEERIKGLISYNKKLLHIDSYSEIQQRVLTFGKKTQNKVNPLISEAHTCGVIVGLAEALNVLKTQPLLEELEQ